MKLSAIRVPPRGAGGAPALPAMEPRPLRATARIATDTVQPSATRFRPLPAALLAICLILSVGIAASWNNPGIGQDEGLLLQYPELIVHGEVPFRDFQSSYGPGTYLPLAAAYEAFGPSVTVERAVGAAERAAIILAIVAFLSPLGAALTLCGTSMAVAGILGTGPPTAYGWYGALACALWAIWLARSALRRGSSGGNWLWAGAGLLIGATASVRPDLGAATLLASLVLVAGAYRRERWSFAGGFAVGLAPLGWNVAAAGVSAFWSYAVQARFHTLPESGALLSFGGAPLGILLVGTAIVLIAAIREWRRFGLGPMTRCWLALAILCVLLLPQYLQRTDAGHFAFVAPVVLALLPWAVSSGGKLSAPTRVVIPILAALVVGFDASLAVDVPSYSVHHAARSFAVATRPERADLQAVVRYVDRHTSPGERIFVGTRDLRWAVWANTSLYYLLPALRPSSFYLEFGPGDNTTSFTARLSDDLRRAEILVLESVSAQTRRSVYPDARAGSNLPNTIVAHYFRIGFQAGTYSVFLRMPQIAPARLELG
jgi:hypothetical protein